MVAKKMFLGWAVIILCGVAVLLYVREHRLRTATVNDLVRAVYAQDKRKIDEILEHRPELVNARNREGFTALYLVCGPPGPIDMAEFLIEKGADVNARMANSETALIMAVTSLQPEIVRLLLSNGADPDATTGGGDHVLFIAAQQGRKDLIKLLVEHGANVNAKNRDGQTILFYDMILKDNGFIKTLVKRGIDVNVRDNADRMTAVEKARRYKYAEAVKILTAARDDANTGY
jgi:serine/threonine-protein phosphatase 6 regulatory ankyrin repeat subunit B